MRLLGNSTSFGDAVHAGAPHFKDETHMNKIIMGLAAASLALAAPAAMAQTKAPSSPYPKGVFFGKQLPSETLAKDRLIGQSVTGKDGQVIGTIDDLILDADNKVIGVIVGVGGFIGVGEKQVAARYAALKFSEVDGKTQISLPTATKEELTKMNPYERLTPKKTLIQRATDAAKDAAKKAGEAAQKAKEAVTGTPTPAPTTTSTPAPAPAPTPAPSTTPPATSTPPAATTPPAAPKAPQ